MTLAELDRYFKSRQRQIKAEQRNKASFDYILADLIGRSMARLYSSSAKMPSIADAYPSLFSNEETRVANNQQRFMAGLQQFAQSYNKTFEEVAKDK